MSTDFVDITRRDAIYRENRLADFSDVELRPSAELVREQARRCMGCGIPFCHGYGCPLANSISEINAAVAAGNIADAYKILSQTSPFPEFTSRICPALCESACVASLPGKSVTVRQIEFFVIEEAFRLGLVMPKISRRKSGFRVAVIGAGPSGLAAAQRLNSMGHEVVVFEKNRFAGGLLRYGIPDFKLEKHIIERRINLMRESGVSFEFELDVGGDVSSSYLRKKFDALCLCIGCETPRDLPIEGCGLSGIHFALDFLCSQNRTISGESKSLAIDVKGKKVLVIGGGDTGSDCVGTALRQGAASVTQIEIMPEPPAKRHSSTPWPEWEYKKRTSSSHLEGGSRMWNVISKSFVGNKSGKLKKLCAARADWKFDALGRPVKFEEIENSDFDIEADVAMLAMGFVKPASPKFVEELGLSLNAKGLVDCNANMGSNIDGVFAGGDTVSGASLVVKAIASGLKMADATDKYLNSLR